MKTKQKKEESFGGRNALPFSTTDALLANCLRDAGFNECPWSPKNIYDADILFRAGGGQKDENGKVIINSRFAGMPLIEAARQAWKERTKGRIEYHFEHTPELQYFLQAYDDQILRFEEGEGDLSEAIREIMRQAAGRELECAPGEKPAEIIGNSFPMEEREAVFRIGVLMRKGRIEYVNRWKHVVPTLSIRESGLVEERPIEGGGTRRSFPGVKEVPVNAPEETLKKLKLI